MRLLQPRRAVPRHGRIGLAFPAAGGGPHAPPRCSTRRPRCAPPSRPCPGLVARPLRGRRRPRATIASRSTSMVARTPPRPVCGRPCEWPARGEVLVVHRSRALSCPPPRLRYAQAVGIAAASKFVYSSKVSAGGRPVPCGLRGAMKLCSAPAKAMAQWRAIVCFPNRTEEIHHR